MKILFAGPENAWGGFLGLIKSKLPQHEFLATGKFEVRNLSGYDVLIPTMAEISASVIKTADQLRLIQQCGSGLEGVDIEAARKHRIQVANVPTEFSGNADSVAELGIFLMIGLARNYHQMNLSIKNQKTGQPQGMALLGKTVGIIGIGGIGKALIKRLKPFGVRLIGIKRNVTKVMQQSLGLDWLGSVNDLDVLLEQSDFIVLSLPITPDSNHMINAEVLGKMKKEAFLINLSRGGLIEYDALKAALVEQKIAGAGLDVFWEEPPDPEDDIFKTNLIATPHIAGSTDVSINGIVEGVTENIQRLETGQKIQNTH
jgi:phosphoglycerate dehydrogenase-like enzyme